MTPIQEKIQFAPYTWIDVVEPDAEMISELAKKYKFHELDVEDVLSETQRSKIDDYDSYIFLVLHFPYADKKTGRVKVEALNIFLSTQFFITLHDGNLPQLKEMVNHLKKNLKLRKEMMSKGMGFLLYELLNKLFDDQFPMMEKVEQRIMTLEHDVFNLGGGQRDMLRDILHLKKDIITFERVIGPLRTVIPQLEYKNDKFIPEGLEIYFDDVVDKVEKIWAMLANEKEVIELLQSTNESVISHATSNVIKILTFFSVVMLPLTAITGFFGMNVIFPLDFGANPMAYFYISASMVAVIVVMIAFFKLKRWI